MIGMYDTIQPFKTYGRTRHGYELQDVNNSNYTDEKYGQFN